MYSRERSVHHRVIFSTPVTTRAVARSPFDRFEKRKKVKLERRRKCWQDKSVPADSKWNCALTPQAKDNNNPSNVLAFNLAFKVLSLISLSLSLWPLSLNAVHCPVEKFKTQAKFNLFLDAQQTERTKAEAAGCDCPITGIWRTRMEKGYSLYCYCYIIYISYSAPYMNATVCWV